MKILLSPAKTLDLSPLDLPLSEARFLDQAAVLVDILRALSPAQLSELMDISEDLANLNYERFAAWRRPFVDAKAAAFMFKGDVYEGLALETLSPEFFDDLQRKVRILSGLYGILRPMDAILPYRLEMGTRLKNAAGANLYAFWGDQLTQSLNEECAAEGCDLIVNLASEEYAKSLKIKNLQAQVIAPKFLDVKNGQARVISFYAKRARGLMARFIVEHRLERADDLRAFAVEGYRWQADASSEGVPVFVREHEN